MHQQQPPAPTRPQPRRTRLASTLTLALGLLTLTSCAPTGPTITVFAPSSLSRAGADLQAAYQEAHPGQTITINYAGSPSSSSTSATEPPPTSSSPPMPPP